MSPFVIKCSLLTIHPYGCIVIEMKLIINYWRNPAGKAPVEKYIDGIDNIDGGRKMKSDLDKHIERQIKDREFKIYFEKAEAKRKLAQAIALSRKAQHISQAQLAKEISTTQQVISRLESPRDKRMPSLELLDRVAKALNKKLVISLQS